MKNQFSVNWTTQLLYSSNFHRPKIEIKVKIYFLKNIKYTLVEYDTIENFRHSSKLLRLVFGYQFIASIGSKTSIQYEIFVRFFIVWVSDSFAIPVRFSRGQRIHRAYGVHLFVICKHYHICLLCGHRFEKRFAFRKHQKYWKSHRTKWALLLLSISLNEQFKYIFNRMIKYQMNFRMDSSQIKEFILENQSTSRTIQQNYVHMGIENYSKLLYVAREYCEFLRLLHHWHGPRFISIAGPNMVTLVMIVFQVHKHKRLVGLFAKLPKFLLFKTLSKGFHLIGKLRLDIWSPSYSNISYMAMNYLWLRVRRLSGLGHIGLQCRWLKKFSAFYNQSTMKPKQTRIHQRNWRYCFWNSLTFTEMSNSWVHQPNHLVK